MSERHASASELELYVIEALDPITAAEIESHVMECEACAERLAGEARLEMAFEQVAANAASDARPANVTKLHARRSLVHRGTVTIACALGGAVSLAAAWLLWISPGGAPAEHVHGAGGQDVAVHHDSYLDDASGTTASLDARLRDGLDGG
jgi:anti-sigma factor RsiW